MSGAYDKWYTTVAATQPNHAGTTDKQDCVKMKFKVTDSAITRFGMDDVVCTAPLQYVCQYSTI